MGLPGLLIDIVGSGPVTTLDTAVARWLHWTRPDRCLSWQMGLPELMVVHIAVMALWLHWTRPDRCLPWIVENLICDCGDSKISIKYHSQNRKPMTVAIRPRSQSDYNNQLKKGIKYKTFKFKLNILHSIRGLIHLLFQAHS